MIQSELRTVVAKIQAGDNRQVDELTLRSWWDTIGDLNYQDALDAVTLHRRESTEYLQPAHVRSNARRLRNERGMRDESIERGAYHSCPKPDNFEAMTAAWRGSPKGPRTDPVEVAEWRHQMSVYNRQLIDAGHDSCVAIEYAVAPARYADVA